jgi:hypothetical protein
MNLYDAFNTPSLTHELDANATPASGTLLNIGDFGQDLAFEGFVDYTPTGTRCSKFRPSRGPRSSQDIQPESQHCLEREINSTGTYSNPNRALESGIRNVIVAGRAVKAGKAGVLDYRA